MKDLFSAQADTYAKFRPLYPAELYSFLYSHVKHFSYAWDCATGNGQVARELAKKFAEVLATDMSEAQLRNATPDARITYKKANEELPGIIDNTFDLVTVAAALHWLNFDSFYQTVKRTSKPGGVLAVWCYSLLKVNDKIDPLINEFTFGTLKNYWDEERKWVDENYRTIPFPFEEIEAPGFSIREVWTLERLEGYLNSWSSVQHYIKANEINPVNTLIAHIKPLWQEEMSVELPLAMRVGRVRK